MARCHHGVMDDLSCGQCWDEAHRALDAERAAPAETRKALADALAEVKRLLRDNSALASALASREADIAASARQRDEVQAEATKLFSAVVGAMYSGTAPDTAVRKALDAERARVERVREVLTSCAWHIPDGTWLRGAVAAALADAPAQADAVDARAGQ